MLQQLENLLANAALKDEANLNIFVQNLLANEKFLRQKSRHKNQLRLFEQYRNESLKQLFSTAQFDTGDLSNFFINDLKWTHSIYSQFLEHTTIDYLPLYKYISKYQTSSFGTFNKTTNTHLIDNDRAMHFVCKEKTFFQVFNSTANTSFVQACLCGMNKPQWSQLNTLFIKYLNETYLNKKIIKLFNKSFETDDSLDEQTENDVLSNQMLVGKFIDDLASVASHLPQGLCTTKNGDLIMKQGEQMRSRRQPGMFAEQINDPQVLKDLPGFIGLWANMQRTFCGIENTPSKQMNNTDAINISKEQMNTLSLVFHVITSNPIILYSPNSSLVQDVLIKGANSTFELIDAVNGLARQWLNVSNDLTHYLEHLNNKSSYLPRQLDVIDSAACSWLKLMSSVNLNVFKGFRNESELVDYFLNKAYSQNETVIASVVFDIKNVTRTTLDPYIHYKIRQNASFTYSTKKIRERYWYPSPRDWDYYYYIFGKYLYSSEYQE